VLRGIRDQYQRYQEVVPRPQCLLKESLLPQDPCSDQAPPKLHKRLEFLVSEEAFQRVLKNLPALQHLAQKVEAAREDADLQPLNLRQKIHKKILQLKNLAGSSA